MDIRKWNLFLTSTSRAIDVRKKNSIKKNSCSLNSSVAFLAAIDESKKLKTQPPIK
jgi:hypothetical protein